MKKHMQIVSAVENELQEDDQLLINPLNETVVCDPENFGLKY